MKVKLEDVIEGLEFVNDGMDTTGYYNPKTKEIDYVDEYSSTIDDEEELEGCILLPTKYDIDEYGMMEDFIETIEDVRLYNQLQIAINGRGAFRRFKDTCINFGVIEDWYKFRDEEYKKIAIGWCEEHNIKYEK